MGKFLLRDRVKMDRRFSLAFKKASKIKSDYLWSKSNIHFIKNFTDLRKIFLEISNICLIIQSDFTDKRTDRRLIFTS